MKEITVRYMDREYVINATGYTQFGNTVFVMNEVNQCVEVFQFTNLITEWHDAIVKEIQ